MKTKNVMLVIADLVFAMGSAFASMLISPIEILVKPVGEELQCKVVPFDCNNVGVNQCKVRVLTITGVKLAKVWLFQSGCTIPLFDNRPFVGSVVLPQDLDEEEIEDVE